MKSKNDTRAPNTLRILVVDDERVQRETLASLLNDHGYSVLVAHDVPSAELLLRTEVVDITLSDFRLPGGSGVDVARLTADYCPDAVTLIMTAFADVDSVIDAMRVGVVDYFQKPLNVSALLLRLARIAEVREMVREIRFLRAEVNRSSVSSLLLGDTAEMRRIRELVAQVADSKGTVLITGESGTGKEIVARQIHAQSPQSGSRFVAVNCAALPETLLESELFGHKKGAFTGATSHKQGLFVVANGGTIFLDEIGEMPKSLQVKLLRVLQEREVLPVGETNPIKVNIRVVAATNRDLPSEVAKGSFRQDLFYRLNVVEIKVPPLRARPADIPLLARHFVEKYANDLGRPVRPLAEGAMQALLAYSWPGNVRELENVIERSIILGKNPEHIELIDLPAELASVQADDLSLDAAVQSFCRDHLRKVLAMTHGDKREAARRLGVGLSSLYRKLDELGLAQSQNDSE